MPFRSTSPYLTQMEKDQLEDALQEAVACGDVEKASTLRTRVSSMGAARALLQAARLGHRDMIEALNKDLRGYDQAPALMAVVRHGRADLVPLLLHDMLGTRYIQQTVAMAATQGHTHVLDVIYGQEIPRVLLEQKGWGRATVEQCWAQCPTLDPKQGDDELGAHVLAWAERHNRHNLLMMMTPIVSTNSCWMVAEQHVLGAGEGDKVLDLDWMEQVLTHHQHAHDRVNQLFKGACENNKLQLVELILSKVVLSLEPPVNMFSIPRCRHPEVMQRVAASPLVAWERLKSHELYMLLKDDTVDFLAIVVPRLNVIHNNSSLLRQAARQGSWECVKLLLPHGDAKAEHSEVLRWAAHQGNKEMVDVLWAHSDPLDALEIMKEEATVHDDIPKYFTSRYTLIEAKIIEEELRQQHQHALPKPLKKM